METANSFTGTHTATKTKKREVAVTKNTEKSETSHSSWDYSPISLHKNVVPSILMSKMSDIEHLRFHCLGKRSIEQPSLTLHLQACLRNCMKGSNLSIMSSCRNMVVQKVGPHPLQIQKTHPKETKT